jgi:hypothetical protein
MIRYRKNPGKGSSKVIEVDGRKYEAKYVGKGQYSKVYRIGDRVVYYTRGDCGKEVLAMYQYSRMAHLPEIIRHENITMPNGVRWYVFSSPYYRDVSSRDISAWALMKQIIRVANAAFNIGYATGYTDLILMNLMVSIIRKNKSLPNSVIKALQEIVNVSSNCGGDIGFDFHKKNFGVNEYGTLIFRDPVHVRS